MFGKQNKFFNLKKSGFGESLICTSYQSSSAMCPHFVVLKFFRELQSTVGSTLASKKKWVTFFSGTGLFKWVRRAQRKQNHKKLSHEATKQRMSVSEWVAVLSIQMKKTKEDQWMKKWMAVQKCRKLLNEPAAINWQ